MPTEHMTSSEFRALLERCREQPAAAGAVTLGPVATRSAPPRPAVEAAAIHQPKTVKPAIDEGTRLLKLAQVLIAVGQEKDGRAMLAAAANLGNAEAAAALGRSP